MKVGIDALALSNPMDGSQSFVRNLLKLLSTVDAVNDYTIFVRSPEAVADIAVTDKMLIQTVASNQARMRIPFALSRAILRSGVDVLHAQFAAPLVCPSQIVVTIHDILFERYPQFFHPSDLRQLRIRVPLTVRRAAAVLTGSEFSKQDIARRYAIAPDKIVVAPYAPDPMFRPIHDTAQLARVSAQYRTTDNYVLFVGVLKPNKNVRTLVEAYVRLRRANRIDHKLVLVGSEDALQSDVRSLVKDAGCSNDLVFTGHIPASDLVALYNSATVFVQPSIFEGFGLPSLEAMACGTPVITSNTSAIPEVVDDAALLVNPLDVDELANALEVVLHDENLRSRLSVKGLARAGMFSWETTARTIVHVYEATAGLSPQSARRRC